MDHGGGRDRDKEFIPGPELKQPSLVHRVEGVLRVWGPALGSYTLQQLDGSQVGRLLVYTLDQLVTGCMLVPFIKGWVAEVHLRMEGEWDGWRERERDREWEEQIERETEREAGRERVMEGGGRQGGLYLIHSSEPTRRERIEDGVVGLI